MSNINRQLHINRRMVLKGAGVSIALPFLSAMTPAFGKNQNNPIPRRFIAINGGLGFHGPDFFPAESGKDYKLSPYLQLLKDHRSKFTVFSGLSHPNQNGNNGHASEHTWLTSAQRPGLAGFKNTISLDQLMAKQIGAKTRYPCLCISTNGQSLSWTSNGVKIPSERSALKLYKKLFVNGSDKDIAKLMKDIERGKSILDAIGHPAKALNRTLSKKDQEKFDEYLSSIRDLEKRLAQNQAWAKKPKPEVDYELKKDYDKGDVIAGQTLMYDLMKLALQTDLTRVITFQLGSMNAVPKNIDGVKSDWHNLSHHGKDPAKIAELRLIEQAELKRFNIFLKALSAVKEQNKSLLDQTAILFGSNLGNASSHDWHNLPVLVAGGGFKHGSHISHDAKNNTPFANLFVSLGQHMGLEIDSFGSSTSAGIKGFS